MITMSYDAISIENSTAQACGGCQIGCCTAEFRLLFRAVFHCEGGVGRVSKMVNSAIVLVPMHPMVVVPICIRGNGVAKSLTPESRLSFGRMRVGLSRAKLVCLSRFGPQCGLGIARARPMDDNPLGAQWLTNLPFGQRPISAISLRSTGAPSPRCRGPARSALV